MSQAFTLQPFAPIVFDLKVTGEIDRQADQLAIQYCVRGEIDQVLWPTDTAQPRRQFALWEATCLEFFLAPFGEQYYWEFNLATNGDWNVFRLDDYRQGLQDELAVQSLPLQVSRTNTELILDMQLSVAGWRLSDRLLEVAVTTVIQEQNGNYSYWALQHTGEAADFHRRADFAIHL